MRSPVALIIFNRPEVTGRVFAEVARARPPKLFVIADGPRPDKAGEFETCAATRAIIDRVDWDCEVFKNYSDVNLGCGHRPPTGLRWVFEHVDEAVILEDDCLPHPTFFRFCDELLERYRDDQRIMHISGDSFHSDVGRESFSYSFSCYSLTWGWATWRRAFSFYDREMKMWPDLRNTSWPLDNLDDPRAVLHWNRIFEKAYVEGPKANYWAYQWLFAIWAQRGLSILPNSNLISNIGYGGDATHTKRTGDLRANLPTQAVDFPLKHPPFMIRNRQVDRLTFERVVRPPGKYPRYRKLRAKCAAVIPPPLRKLLSRGGTGNSSK